MRECCRRNRYSRRARTRFFFLLHPIGWINQDFSFFTNQTASWQPKGEKMSINALPPPLKKRTRHAFWKNYFPFRFVGVHRLGNWCGRMRDCVQHLFRKEIEESKKGVCRVFLFSLRSTPHNILIPSEGGGGGGGRGVENDALSFSMAKVSGEGSILTLALSLLSSWLPAGGKDGKGREGGVSLFSGLEGDSY